MKVLVIGRWSSIGSKIAAIMLEKGFQVFGSYVRRKHSTDPLEVFLDITDRAGTIEQVGKVRPDLVVHTASLSNMDECEIDKKKAWAINVEGTRNVVEACSLFDSRILYISTSAVFDGREKSYNEDDQPSPVNYYGLTKLEGERIVLRSKLPFLTARIDHPYGWVSTEQKQNTATRVISTLRAGGVFRATTEWYNTPTFLDNCAEVMVSLLERNMNGIYDVVGPDFVSRYEFAVRIANAFQLDTKLVKPVSAKELGLVARRGNVRLLNGKAENDSGTKLLGIEDGVRVMVSTISRSNI